MPVMLASGAAALGDEIIWTQQAALWLGHEGAAALAVVAAFFGGLALGAALLAGPIARSCAPARWYACSELVVGLWSLVLVLIMQPASTLLTDLLGPSPTPTWQACVTFGGTALLLLPATLAMGATLPALERMLSQLRQGGANLGLLYAGNTLGGVLGVLGVAFWLVPRWGLTAAALACAGLSGLCALATWAFGPAPGPVARVAGVGSSPAWDLRARLIQTGALGIGYEVVVLRVLSQVAENTVYTLALLLAVYLIGTALGAAAWARRGRRASGDAHGALLLALALACTGSGAALWMAPWLHAALSLLLGEGFHARLTAEALLAALAFGPPTAVMGALFSQLCHEARLSGLGFAQALALNTAGAALAPLLFGAGLLVALGAKVALAAVVAGYLVLAVPVRGRQALLVLAAVAALAGWVPALVFVDVPPGGRVLSHREGALGAVSVTEDPAGERLLRINNRQQEGSNRTALADARQALLPVLLHPAPRSALFLGLGTGVTARAAALDARVDVLAVELLPEVVGASELFNDVLGGDRQPANFHVQVADARRFVRTSPRHWDLIVSDNFHPARAGSGALYTVEHFRAVRERLATGGAFCQWLPLHQMDLATLRSIVRSFMLVNPGGAALLATNSLQTPVLGLWARRDGQALGPEQATARLRDAGFTPGPGAFALPDEWALLGSFVAGPGTLARWAEGAPLNTDDHPVVSYLAPRATYAPEATPGERLAQLLEQWSGDDSTWLAPGASPAQLTRLQAYRRARQGYLLAGVGVRPSADPSRMLAQVREPLLAALRASPDFRPAYEPLLRLAQAQHDDDPLAAQQLLAELLRLAPDQPGAREALHAMRSER